MKKQTKKTDYTQFKTKPIKFLFFVMRQWKGLAIFAFMAVTLGAGLQASMFLVVKHLTNNVEKGNPSETYHWIVILILVMSFMNFSYRTSGFIASRLITNMEMFAGMLSFRYLLGHSAGYFADRLSGKLQNKIFQIARAMDQLTAVLLWSFWNLFVKLSFFLLFAFSANSAIGIVSLIIIVIIVAVSSLMAPALLKGSKEYSEKQSVVKGVIVDIIANILATKQNVAQRKEINYVSKYYNKYRQTHLKIWRKFDTTLIVSNFLAIAFLGVVLSTVVYFWQINYLTIGDVMLFLAMLISLYGNIENLSVTINTFLENTGKLQEGLEEIFIPYEIQDNSTAKRANIKKGEIVFNKVNFHYEDDKNNTVFKNLSLTIPAGQKIGLVGESGAGKSTFVSLLLRFMDVQSGEIRVDDYNIKNIKQNDLRRAIAYVPQEALLFHRTLEENIKYSNPKATKKEILEASQKAYALEFIKKFPSGFKTLVGERGVKLSGGQKQRIMIARAMLKQSPILVLDEATSALDSNAEQKIQKALETLMQGRTTIAIAHRLSTLKQMDRIIVFENGKIIEDGTHQELLKQKGKYWELWRHQTGASC